MYASVVITCRIYVFVTIHLIHGAGTDTGLVSFLILAETLKAF